MYMYRALCVLTLLNASLFAGFSDPAKQRKWDETALRIENTADGFGMAIDANIKQTVIILNVLGFKTNASCEGHEEEGSCYPWITLSASEDDSLAPAYNTLQKQIKKSAKERQKLEKKYPKQNVYQLGKKSNKLLRLSNKIREAHDEISLGTKRALLKLNDLICAFYETRTTTHDRRLYIHFVGGYQVTTLQSIGADWQECYTQEQKVKKLKEYQEEMNLFTEFLIKHYDAS